MAGSPRARSRARSRSRLLASPDDHLIRQDDKINGDRMDIEVLVIELQQGWEGDGAGMGTGTGTGTSGLGQEDSPQALGLQLPGSVSVSCCP